VAQLCAGQARAVRPAGGAADGAGLGCGLRVSACVLRVCCMCMLLPALMMLEHAQSLHPTSNCRNASILNITNPSRARPSASSAWSSRASSSTRCPTPATTPVRLAMAPARCWFLLIHWADQWGGDCRGGCINAHLQDQNTPHPNRTPTNQPRPSDSHISPRPLRAAPGGRLQRVPRPAPTAGRLLVGRCGAQRRHRRRRGCVCVCLARVCKTSPSTSNQLSQPTNPNPPAARKKEIPIVQLNPGGVLNWKYEGECAARAAGFPYTVVRCTGGLGGGFRLGGSCVGCVGRLVVDAHVGCLTRHLCEF
jgi:hypothetical protein